MKGNKVHNESQSHAQPNNLVAALTSLSISLIYDQNAQEIKVVLWVVVCLWYLAF